MISIDENTNILLTTVNVSQTNPETNQEDVVSYLIHMEYKGDIYFVVIEKEHIDANDPVGEIIPKGEVEYQNFFDFRRSYMEHWSAFRTECTKLQSSIDEEVQEKLGNPDKKKKKKQQ